MTNNTWSKSLLNDESYDSLKGAVLLAVAEILQRIIKEIIPLILEKVEQNYNSRITTNKR